MSGYDLLIVGGWLVDDRHEVRADIAVLNGTIAAVGMPGAFAQAGAARTIDAEGRLVMPGGIDAHVHFNFGLPPLLSQGYRQGSRAALYGGTTTVLDFAFRAPGGGSPSEAVAAKRAEAANEMDCDYGLHLILAGPISGADLAAIPDVVAAGVTTVKVFMNFPALYPGDGATAALFRVLASSGGVGVVHAENGDVIGQLASELVAAGKDSYKFADDSRPDWVEAEAVQRAISLARPSATSLFVLHVTSGAAAAVIAAARARGERVFAETCHNYLVFSKDDVVDRPDGANWGNFPPLRPPSDREALWAAVAGGVIDHVSTDDYTNDLANRNAVGLALPTPPAGHNGIETRMRVLNTEAVERRGFRRTDLVRLTSTGIAKRFGLWPRKGSLEVGADADLIVFDASRSGTFELASLHTADYSIWDGYAYQGEPVMTILRGQVMVEEGRFVGPTGGGSFIPTVAGA